jgi:hypothetical protein
MKSILSVMLLWLLLVGAARAQFVPPHGHLPDDETCRKAVIPTSENRPVNTPFNQTVPTDKEMEKFHNDPLGFNGPPASDFARVNGSYTGSTDMIAQWAACKWGMDPTMMRAQMYIESGWTETVQGDDEFSQDICVGENGWSGWEPSLGKCWTSYSLVQIKCTNYNACPMAYESTPFALDFRGSYWRACMEGHIDYYRHGPTLPGYPKYPDGTPEEMAYGCAASWYSGNWYDALAINSGYLDHLKEAMRDKPWQNPVFITEPLPYATVHGQVKVAIQMNNPTGSCAYGCLSSDAGFISCSPGGGPWMFDSTKVSNGTHSLTVQTNTCSGAVQDVPTGWPWAMTLVNVQNASNMAATTTTSSYKKPRKLRQATPRTAPWWGKQQEQAHRRSR